MVSYALFDLDDTLYPRESGLGQFTMGRILDFAARIASCTVEELRTKREERLRSYGTTLEWLMAEYGFSDIEEYYAYVHPEGEESLLSPDPDLGAFLRSLPVPASVLTNAPIEHAERVIKKLELENVFERIFDIRWNGLRGKPAESAFRNVLELIDRQPQETLFVDDLPSYVEGYTRIGGFGVLLDSDGRHQDALLPRVKSLLELNQFFGSEK